MKQQIHINPSTINEFESARQDYLRELNKLKVKYSIIFNNIAQGAHNDKITAVNR